VTNKQQLATTNDTANNNTVANTAAAAAVVATNDTDTTPLINATHLFKAWIIIFLKGKIRHTGSNPL
jgi:hypothetical protein